MISALVLLNSWPLAAGHRAPEETYTIAYRPKVGAVTRSIVSAIYKVGGPTVEVRYTLRQEIVAVEKDGTYRAKTAIGSKSYREGTKPAIQNEAVEEYELRYNARGESLPNEDDDDEPKEDDPVNDLMRLAAGYEPKTPVKLGESWTPPMDERLNLYPLKYTLVGIGPHEGRSELFLQGRGPGRDGAKLDVQVWVDAETFAPHRSIVHITNAPTQTGNDGDVLVTIETKVGA